MPTGDQVGEGAALPEHAQGPVARADEVAGRLHEAVEHGTHPMQKFSLDARVREHLERATAATSSGRSAETVYGGHEHVLRQTLIALRGGTELSEHENPGEATVLVLRGRVRLRSEDDAWEGMAGDLLLVPRGCRTARPAASPRAPTAWRISPFTAGARTSRRAGPTVSDTGDTVYFTDRGIEELQGRRKTTDTDHRVRRALASFGNGVTGAAEPDRHRTLAGRVRTDETVLVAQGKLYL